MKKISDSERFLNQKKTEQVYWKKEKHHKIHEERKTRSNKIESSYRSKLLNMLSIRPSILNPRRTYEVDIKIPAIFSIIENPTSVIDIVCHFARKIRKNPKARVVKIDHSTLSDVDLAAESILDLAIMEFRRECAVRRRKAKIQGVLPKDKKLNRYIRAVGIIKNLDISDAFLPEDEETELRIFRMRNGRYAIRDTLSGADYKEMVVSEFVDHVDSCIKDHGRELTREAKILLAKYTGELLANAEEHSKFNDWSIVGYLDNSTEPHFCEIAIFNFGLTISETFHRLDDDHYSKKLIQPYIDTHTNKSLFERGWKIENLVTLIALQGGVSCMNSSENDTRGNGTVDMIEFFQDVYDECCAKSSKFQAKMAIVSGSTYILFDGTYRMASGKDGRKVIAFNKENALYSKPDSKYVQNLEDVYFPGTVISIKFPLQVEDTVLVAKDD